jgi:hypothetical protein
MGKDAIVSHVNWFMSVPVLEDGSAGIANVVQQPNPYVTLLAKTNTLAVLSNFLQVHNPHKGCNPTQVKIEIYSNES